MTANPSYPQSFCFDLESPVFRAHEGGKLEVVPTKKLRDRADLALLYTPGVADISLAIAADPSLAARYTARGNTVAVITDGTAVLGLGDIGPLAALPVMEGKAVLFKHFAGIDAVPVCLETGTVEELVEAIVRLAPTFGGINLEDISAPRCFEIERRLRERLSELRPMIRDPTAAVIRSISTACRPLRSTSTTSSTAVSDVFAC